MNLIGTRCLKCGQESLVEAAYGKSIQCGNCGAEYEAFHGVPCLIQFNEQDLCLIASDFTSRSVRATAENENEHNSWLHYLENYHNAEDRASYLATFPEGMRAAIPSRHRHFEVVRNLLDGVRLNDMNVLHIGAGNGFYTAYLKKRNAAAITALEQNPLQARRSAEGASGVRWMVGSPRALPFADEQFDLVFCEAGSTVTANIHDCFQEMLRVLKPGGVLVSEGHEFIASRRSADDETDRLAAQTSVLSGRDRASPRFARLWDELDAPEFLKVEVLSSTLRGYPNKEEQRREDVLVPRWWSGEGVERVADSDGVVSFRVTKKMSVPIRPKLVSQTVASLADAIDTATSQQELTARLAKSLAGSASSDAFPGDPAKTKQYMLQGWRPQPGGVYGREGCNRAVWYMKRQSYEHNLLIAVSKVDGGQDEVRLFIDGVERGAVPLTPDARSYNVELTGVPAGETFAVEFVGGAPAKDVARGLFRVDRLAIANA